MDNIYSQTSQHNSSQLHPSRVDESKRDIVAIEEEAEVAEQLQ
ncbi:hypothetical protein FOPG_13720 [Fusarium oxysporum f. sp. conglutinans race 2 54008]|uniref:Uncharacterized protein n=1 Tax=Fusarium oxysporum f. sp. conglutinans race 2 54008 TaxID=1089457 RepID=X0H381_FUSOX|nr:hypothetical protein FOPG_13720 [Fusarium oxysporum f. sp. conglutinans race 2 54008]